MTQPATESPNGAGSPPGRAVRTPPSAVPLRLRRRGQVVRSFPAALVVAGCIAVHLLAAAVVYRDLARDLYQLFDATPRLLVLERGLLRLTAASVFLPPVIPSALLGGVALWVGKARREADVSRWLALATIPLAADGVLRALGVLLAPAPATIGELLDLPSRFSLGPRLILDLAGIRPGASIAYWVAVCTVAAAVSAWCVARALLAAECPMHDSSSHRRRRGMAAIDALQVGIATAGAWIAIAFAGQVALPVATQLFLRLFG